MTKKVVACIIARTVSTRLPLKVLRELHPNISMIDFIIKNLKSKGICDEIYICTSHEPVDDILEDVAERNGVKIYRGSPDEVTERIMAVGKLEETDILVRITGDNPFTSVEFLEEQINFLIKKNLDYVRIIDLPIGATPEVFTLEALKRCSEMMDPKVSEYLMLYLFEPQNFNCGVIKIYNEDYSHYSLTVDTKNDLIRTKKILDLMKFQGDFKDVTLNHVVNIISDHSNELPDRILESGGMIKLPYDKLISYAEFKKDMNRRKINSQIFRLNE